MIDDLTPRGRSTHRTRVRRARLVAGIVSTSLVAAACAGGSTPEPAGSATTTTPATASTAEASAGMPGHLAPGEAAELLRDPPEGLVVLDVRTYDEYAEANLGDVVLLDFYAEDFADRLAELPRDRPYLVYCRSGNRSGQTLQLMRRLGFDEVADIDGGILAWQAAGLPVVG